MRKGFLNGLLTGGLIGAVMGMFMAPQKKQEYKKEIFSSGNKIKRQARKSMKGMRKSIKDMID